MKKLIALLEKQNANTLTLAEGLELSKLLGGKKTQVNKGNKKKKDAHAIAMAKVKTQSENMMRECVKRILEIHADAGVTLTKRDVSISYKGKADKNATRKNVNISIRSRVKRKPVGKSQKAKEQNAVKNEMQKITAKGVKIGVAI